MTRLCNIAGRLGLAALCLLVWLGAGVPPLRAEGNADNGGVTPSVPRPNSRSMAIEVISANYGHIGSPDSCPVTQTLKGSCNGRSRCIVSVGDQLCRRPNIVPSELILTLTVEYKCTPIVAARVVKADKPFHLVIDCSSGLH